MEAPKLKLNTGRLIPAIGFGTGTSFFNRGDDVQAVILSAFQAGFRSYDGATIYGTEEGLGRGLAGLAEHRDNLFITTKTPDWAWTQESIEEEVKKSLERLQLDYLDLVLLHTPAPRVSLFERLKVDPSKHFIPDAMNEKQMDESRLQAWMGLQNCVSKGLVRDIGVSNFTAKHLKKLLVNGEVCVVPAVNQVEFNPYLVDSPLHDYCKEKGILVQAFAPLGNGKDLLEDVTLNKIAQAHGKTVGQVALRWAWQLGIATVTKTEKVERMKENLNYFDFNLTDTEMKEISSLNKNERRFGDPARFP